MPDPGKIKIELAEIEQILKSLSNVPGAMAQKMLAEALLRKQELQAQLSASKNSKSIPSSPGADILTCESMAFCYIPPGYFLFGQGKLQKINLPAFWVGRYPVTNAQFGQFVNAKGYEQINYWIEAEKAKCWTKDGFRGRYDSPSRSLPIDLDNAVNLDKPRTAPVDFGEPFNLPNHPVVGVSWYETIAFTRWLNEKMLEWAAKQEDEAEDLSHSMWKGLMSAEFQLTLPTEEQWEKATRGIHGRAYPWQDEFDTNKANTVESGLLKTSAVGSFPNGQSPYGLLDSSGNVWEWTVTSKGDVIAMCGGSFYHEAQMARCASRVWAEPDYWAWDTGFRVSVSPQPSKN